MTYEELLKAKELFEEKVKNAIAAKEARKKEWMNVCEMAISNNKTYGLHWRVSCVECSGGSIKVNGTDYTRIIPTPELLEEVKQTIADSMKNFKLS